MVFFKTVWIRKRACLCRCTNIIRHQKINKINIRHKWWNASFQSGLSTIETITELIATKSNIPDVSFIMYSFEFANYLQRNDNQSISFFIKLSKLPSSFHVQNKCFMTHQLNCLMPIISTNCFRDSNIFLVYNHGKK